MRNKNGQAAIEIIFTIGIIIFTFLLLAAFTFERKIEVQNFAKGAEVKKDCFKLTNLIVGAFINGEGTTITTKLSENMTAEQNSLYIDENFCGLSANVLKQNFNLAKGKVSIENKNNSIIIQNV
ncbi:hypothetical protein HY643_03615 [Candidatus Woesearchaeota archaeon]|nr:hypothetical protein [Candidatus Woesearchaeota archaeon]